MSHELAEWKWEGAPKPDRKGAGNIPFIFLHPQLQKMAPHRLFSLAFRNGSALNNHCHSSRKDFQDTCPALLLLLSWPLLQTLIPYRTAEEGCLSLVSSPQSP